MWTQRLRLVAGLLLALPVVLLLPSSAWSMPGAAGATAGLSSSSWVSLSPSSSLPLPALSSWSLSVPEPGTDSESPTPSAPESSPVSTPDPEPEPTPTTEPMDPELSRLLTEYLERELSQSPEPAPSAPAPMAEELTPWDSERDSALVVAVGLLVLLATVHVVGSWGRR